MSDRVKRAQTAVEVAETRMQNALDALESADENIGDEELEALNREFDEAETEHKSAKDALAREERIAAARAALPAPVAGGTVTVGQEEPVYRRDSERSYFADLLSARRNGDQKAFERLHKNNEQVRDARKARGEHRATVEVDGSGFQPPIYLADEWVKIARPGRPFANAVPKMDLPPNGTAITVPAMSSGAAVAEHDYTKLDGSNTVQDTPAATDTISHNLVAIAGQNEIDRLILERSYPGLDMVIFDDLRRAYDALVDQKLITGTGTGEYLGLDNVSSPIDVTYDDNSPSAAALLAKVYGAISQVYSQRYVQPEAILMHPRRAAWLASQFDSNFPVFNQGGLNAFQLGDQDKGLVGNMAGLPVIADPNVPVTKGVSTNADTIYVLVMSDLRLAEEGVQSASFEEVASNTLAIRLQLWGYSAAVLNRYPKGIARINGTGLVAPSGF